MRLAARFGPQDDAQMLKEKWDDLKFLEDAAVPMVDNNGQCQKLGKLWNEVFSMNI